MKPMGSPSGHRFRSLWDILAVIVVLSLALLAWGGSATTALASTKASSLDFAKGHTVHTVNIVEVNGRFAFRPATLTIKVGDIVVWKNTTFAPHTVTSNTGVFNTRGILSMNQSFRFTFNRTGTFRYHCNIHLYMTATIIVKTSVSGSSSSNNSTSPQSPPPMTMPSSGGGGY